MVYRIQLLLILINPFVVGESCDLLEHKKLDLVCSVITVNTLYFQEERFRIIKIPYVVLPRRN